MSKNNSQEVTHPLGLVDLYLDKIKDSYGLIGLVASGAAMPWDLKLLRDE